MAHNDSEEWLDILDGHGNHTGEVTTRARAHAEGLPHATVHLWILDSQGRLLLQKRHSAKVSNPDKWDVSVAGHVDAGSSSRDALLREAKEELGLHLFPTDVDWLFTVFHADEDTAIHRHDHEFQEVFLLRRDLDVSELVLQASEVSDARWENWRELEKRVAAGDATLVEHPEEFPKLFAWLKSHS